MPRNLLVGVLVGLLAGGGCAPPGLIVRSDRGQAVMVELQKVRPVEYGKGELRAAMELFADHVTEVIQHQEPKLRVRLASTDPMVEAYLAWCGRRNAPGDCLELLDAKSPGVSNSGKRSIAVRMALGTALEEVAGVVRHVDPMKVEALMLIWFTIYFASLVFPDATITKVVSFVMSANMVAFLGWDGFRTFVLGYRDMCAAADAAQTFPALYDAGRAYGQRMGPSMVRIVTALVTLGLSAATGMSVPVTKLPGGPQAVANAEAQGFHLMAVSGGSVAVSATGTVTIVLNSSALAGSSPTSAQPTPSQPSSTSALVSRVQGQLWRYPKVLDPRTGRPIPFPTRQLKPVPVQQRVPWGNTQRGEFIREWYERGYATPKGGWDNYDIHHIQPRELGGDNDFWNLVPVERSTHQAEFNSFWQEFME